jgi:large subunit ribosomal protein L35
MPKMKTNSSAKKRFQVTASGKVKRKQAFKRHLLGAKSKKQKLRLTHNALVHPSDMSNVKFMLCI